MIALTMLLTLAAVLSGCWWAYRCAILGKWSLPRIPLACLAGVVLLTLASPVWNWVKDLGRPTREEYDTVKQQAENNAEATRQVEHVYRSETIIREKADAAVEAVQASDGAEQALAPDLLSSWRSGRDSVRQSASYGVDPEPAS